MTRENRDIEGLAAISPERVMRTTICLTVAAAMTALGLYAFAGAADGRGHKHSQEAKKTAKAAVETGRGLTVKNRCAVCHTIGGSGGCLAPPLDGVASRRSRAFIYNRITDTEEARDRFAERYGGAELMPHLRLPAKETGPITSYLMTLKEPEGGYKVIGHHGADKTGAADQKPEGTGKRAPAAVDDKIVATGRSLFSGKGCQTCHSIGDIGGHFGPALDHVGSRLTLRGIQSQMENAELLALTDKSEYAERGTVMPPCNLSQEEIDALASFLSTLK